MNKHFLAVAITVVAVSAVLATAATAAAQTATKLSLSVAKTDLQVGESVTASGRLADANGKGIPNQVIHIKWQTSAMGQTFSGQNNTKTDASGNFGGTMNVPSTSAPVKQATVQLTAVYDGNSQYAASQSSPVTLTVHFS
jgi:hypothetical protein